MGPMEHFKRGPRGRLSSHRCCPGKVLAMVSCSDILSEMLGDCNSSATHFSKQFCFVDCILRQGFSVQQS